MLKREMAFIIARAYFPPHFKDDCGAIQAMAKRKEKRNTVKQLERLIPYAEAVLKQRENQYPTTALLVNLDC